MCEYIDRRAEAIAREKWPDGEVVGDPGTGAAFVAPPMIEPVCAPSRIPAMDDEGYDEALRQIGARARGLGQKGS